jgi:hypothetical protein
MTSLPAVATAWPGFHVYEFTPAKLAVLVRAMSPTIRSRGTLPITVSSLD